VQIGQRLLIEGRLRMNTVTRQDGVKEKKAEFTLSRLHPMAPTRTAAAAPVRAAAPTPAAAATSAPAAAPVAAAAPAWNTSPLVPDLGEDDIPF
jgi:single-stranded DNA-binding protein